jgi:hypothetical protein
VRMHGGAYMPSYLASAVPQAGRGAPRLAAAAGWLRRRPSGRGRGATATRFAGWQSCMGVRYGVCVRMFFQPAQVEFRQI